MPRTIPELVAQLERNFAYTCEWQECPPESRLEWLGDYVFNLTTYDGEMSHKMAAMMLGVCLVITSGTNYKFIEDKNDYFWYLVAVNMPFFKGKIQWGSSIRGAWWVHEDITLETTENVDADGNQVCDPTFTQAEWANFILAMNRFVKEDKQ